MNFRAAEVALLSLLLVVGVTPVEAGSPVWKVSDGKGGTLYLGGSIHALRRTDYPLPLAFDVAFEKSDRLVFEDEEGKKEAEKIFKTAAYPSGDSLKKHVDPRTYAYVVKVFSLLGVPEVTVAKYRPWALTMMLWSPANDLGVEGHFLKRARASKKPVSGLVSTREHYAVFTGLTDRQAEGVLLLNFIPREGASFDQMVSAWKGGDADRLWRETHDSYSDYPAFGERLLEARNRRWMPKIEGYLHSGKNYFVIVGMGHLGGPGGLLKLLQQRGYRIEQL